MKTIKTALTIFILSVLWACTSPVTFNEPQPVGTDNLSRIPKRIQGRYLSLADSSAIIINDNLIQRIYDFYEKMDPKRLDSNLKLSGDTLIDIYTKEASLVKQEGDSIIRHIVYNDTLFKISDEHVLRKSKGYYFLNIRYDKDSWKVSKVELSKGALTISNISQKADLENLKEITENTQDTIPPYNFSPTKKQFKEFVRKGGFSETEKFVRLKK